MSRKRPCPSFSKSMLPPRTVVTYRSGSPSLSMSANEAETETLPGTATPADAVMFSNRPPPRFLQLVAANLVHEVDIKPAVAVHVRDRNAGSMIVMDRLVCLSG